ncbi:MAG: hypothetical protein Tsb0010_12140 [Parvularculaceae bacterium]
MGFNPFKRKKTALSRNLSYEEARAALAAQNGEQKRALAVREDAPPETLYFLAEDADPEIRAKVAGNPATPRQADLLLIDDVDEEVRSELARKIGRLLPELDPKSTEKVQLMTLQALDALSRDQVGRVRRILAEEIKACANAPKDVIMRLAHDEMDDVAVPVLEYSPLLSDHDLIELIAAGIAAGGRLEAIARRDGVSADVADQIAATMEVPAVAALLRNKSASIREDTLNQLAEQSEQIREWREPVALRPDLSMRAIRRIAGFVTSEILAQLVERGDLDEETKAELSRRVRARIDGKPEPASDAPQLEDLETKALIEKAEAAGRLDEDFFLEALKRGNKAAARAALARCSGLPPDIVDRMLNSGAAKSVSALVWKAGFSAASAEIAQAQLARIPRARQAPAAEDGGYAMTEDELSWQLACFTGEG